MATIIARRIKCVGPQPSNNDNRMTIEYFYNGSWVTYKVNQSTLNNFHSEAEIKTAAENFLGYTLDNVWFHLNRNGTWAIAIGTKPIVWPEDDTK
jgi:hypothetical protein